MRVDYFYQSPLKYVFLLLGVCLLVISSCKETEEAKEARVAKQLLPLSVVDKLVEDVCPFKEIFNYEEIPEKIRSEAETALLKFMYSADIDRQIEFVKFRSHKKCEKKEPSGGIPHPYSMHYIRHVDNEIISSVAIRLNFNVDKEFTWKSGLASSEIENDPRYKNYISKISLDSILKSHNYLDYDKVNISVGSYGIQTLGLKQKYKRNKNGMIIRRESRASVNLHTGEFNSINEWRKETATNFDLIPKYEGGESIPVQIEKHRHLIDSLLQDGQTPRSASDKLINEGMQYLKDRKAKQAMSLVNLAYLVDSTNANVYWGFGRVSSSYSDTHPFSEIDTKWYDIGLSLDSNNVNLIRASAGNKFRNSYSRAHISNIAKRDSIREENRRSKSFKEAERLYLKAIALVPGHVGTINSLASLYEKQNRIKDAEEWYLKALAISQEDVRTLDNLVSLYLDQDDCKSAIAYYEKTKKLTDYCERWCSRSTLEKKCGEI